MQTTLLHVEQLSTFIESSQNVPMPSRLSFALIKFYEKIKENRGFYLEKLNEILRENVEIDANGQIIVEKGSPIFKENSVENYNKAAQELALTLVDIPSLAIPLEDLEKLPMTIAQMAILKDFIVE